MADEFFTFVKKLPDPTPGLDDLLNGFKGTVNSLQGHYLMLRLLAEAPEVRRAGAVLETVGDRVAERSGKEGIDFILRTSDELPFPVGYRGGAPASIRVPELWEVKYVQNLSSAIKKEQVAKHLVDRVAPVLQILVDRGLRGRRLAEEINKVRLRFDIVLSAHPSATAGAAIKSLNDILKADTQLKALWDAGFRFKDGDVLIRHGNPMSQFVDSLAKLTIS